MSSSRHADTNSGSLALKLYTFWFTADLYSIGLFSFGGVALRMAIKNALTGQVDSSVASNTGPFLQIFYAHPSLASNMLGSFIMAVFLSFLDEITALSPALYKGLTVGFCGSLTALSGWIFNTFHQVMEGSWYEMFIVLVLEFYLIWACFAMGLAAARLTRELWSHPQTEANLGATAIQGASSVEGDIELEDIGEETSEVKQQVEEQLEVPCDYSEAQAAGTGASEPPSNAPDVIPTQEPPRKRFVTEYEYALWAVGFWLVALTVWAVLIALPGIGYYEQITYRDTYRSVALAPLGAWLRWALTRFPSIKAMWPEMNPQTLIANIAAVTIMSAISLSSDNTWITAINAGFCGSLSTVSTFMVELHTLYRDSGAWVSLRYALATVLLSMAIDQISRAGAS